MPFALPQTVMVSPKRERCRHCGSPIPECSPAPEFCCAGCLSVFGLLEAEGLRDYYRVARDEVAPAPQPDPSRTYTWLEPLVAAAETSPGLCTLELDIQGIHCAACVWLVNELFRREPGG